MNTENVVGTQHGGLYTSSLPNPSGFPHLVQEGPNTGTFSPRGPLKLVDSSLGGLSRDISHLSDRVGHGAEPTKQDGGRGFVDTKIPSSRIQEQNFVVERRISTEQPPDPRDYIYDLDSSGKQWHVVVFPALRPSGRRDAVLLEQWLDKKLAEHREKWQKSQDKSISSSARQGEWLNALGQASEIYSTCFIEIVRQVWSNCAERGKLLQRVWEYHQGLFARIQKTLDKRTTKQDRELQTVEKRAKSLEHRLNAQVIAGRELQNRVNELEHEVARREELVAEVAKLKERLEWNEIQRLNQLNRIDELTAICDKHTAEKEALEREYRGEIGDMKHRHGVESSRLKISRDKVDAENKRSLTEIDEMRALLTEHQTALAHSREENEVLRAEREMLRHQVTEGEKSKSDLALLKETIEKMTHRHREDLVKQNEKHDQTLSEIHRRIAVLQSGNDDLQGSLRTADVTLKVTKAEYRKRYDELNQSKMEEVGALKATVTNLETELRELRVGQRAMTLQLKRAQQDNASARNETQATEFKRNIIDRWSSIKDGDEAGSESAEEEKDERPQPPTYSENTGRAMAKMQAYMADMRRDFELRMVKRQEEVEARLKQEEVDAKDRMQADFDREKASFVASLEKEARERREMERKRNAREAHMARSKSMHDVLEERMRFERLFEKFERASMEQHDPLHRGDTTPISTPTPASPQPVRSNAALKAIEDCDAQLSRIKMIILRDLGGSAKHQVGDGGKRLDGHVASLLQMRAQLLRTRLELWLAEDRAVWLETKVNGDHSKCIVELTAAIDTLEKDIQDAYAEDQETAEKTPRVRSRKKPAPIKVPDPVETPRRRSSSVVRRHGRANSMTTAPLKAIVPTKMIEKSTQAPSPTSVGPKEMETNRLRVELEMLQEDMNTLMQEKDDAVAKSVNISLSLEEQKESLESAGQELLDVKDQLKHCQANNEQLVAEIERVREKLAAAQQFEMLRSTPVPTMSSEDRSIYARPTRARAPSFSDFKHMLHRSSSIGEQDEHVMQLRPAYKGLGRSTTMDFDRSGSVGRKRPSPMSSPRILQERPPSGMREMVLNTRRERGIRANVQSPESDAVRANVHTPESDAVRANVQSPESDAVRANVHTPESDAVRANVHKPESDAVHLVASQHDEYSTPTVSVDSEMVKERRTEVEDDCVKGESDTGITAQKSISGFEVLRTKPSESRSKKGIGLEAWTKEKNAKEESSTNDIQDAVQNVFAESGVVHLDDAIQNVRSRRKMQIEAEALSEWESIEHARQLEIAAEEARLQQMKKMEEERSLEETQLLIEKEAASIRIQKWWRCYCLKFPSIYTVIGTIPMLLDRLVVSFDSHGLMICRGGVSSISSMSSRSLRSISELEETPKSVSQSKKNADAFAHSFFLAKMVADIDADAELRPRQSVPVFFLSWAADHYLPDMDTMGHDDANNRRIAVRAAMSELYTHLLAGLGNASKQMEGGGRTPTGLSMSVGGSVLCRVLWCLLLKPRVSEDCTSVFDVNRSMSLDALNLLLYTFKLCWGVKTSGSIDEQKKSVQQYEGILISDGAFMPYEDAVELMMKLYPMDTMELNRNRIQQTTITHTAHVPRDALYAFVMESYPAYSKRLDQWLETLFGAAQIFSNDNDGLVQDEFIEAVICHHQHLKRRRVMIMFAAYSDFTSQTMSKATFVRAFRYENIVPWERIMCLVCQKDANTLNSLFRRELPLQIEQSFLKVQKAHSSGGVDLIVCIGRGDHCPACLSARLIHSTKLLEEDAAMACMSHRILDYGLSALKRRLGVKKKAPVSAPKPFIASSRRTKRHEKQAVASDGEVSEDEDGLDGPPPPLPPTERDRVRAAVYRKVTNVRGSIRGGVDDGHDSISSTLGLRRTAIPVERSQDFLPAPTPRQVSTPPTQRAKKARTAVKPYINL